MITAPPPLHSEGVQKWRLTGLYVLVAVSVYLDGGEAHRGRPQLGC
jgi:hypothetical protein